MAHTTKKNSAKARRRGNISEQFATAGISVARYAFASCLLLSSFSDLEFHPLRAECGMSGCQSDHPGLFLRANPNPTCAADERKGIVSDNLRWPFDLQFDGVIRERTDGTNFIGDAQNHSRGIRPVADESQIIRHNRELGIHSPA